MRTQTEWKVPAQMSLAAGPSIVSSRCLNSPAALFVKVMQRMFHGRAGETGRRAQELGDFILRAAFEQRIHHRKVFFGAGGNGCVLIRVAEMDQVRDAVNQHGRFPAARTGQNKQRPVDRINGLPLLRVEERIQLIEKRAFFIRIDIPPARLPPRLRHSVRSSCPPSFFRLPF